MLCSANADDISPIACETLFVLERMVDVHAIAASTLSTLAEYFEFFRKRADA